MSVYTTFYQSPVGCLKIVSSDDHLQAVLFVEENERTTAVCSHPVLDKCIRELEEYFAGSRKDFSLSLQQSGTSFQQKVWDLLLRIPYGKTVSYSDLSKQYGDPKAIRAVASANGKNNLAIIVPCHRVIGSNQSLTGYAGGLWRKKWLLEHEAKHHSGVMTLF